MGFARAGHTCRQIYCQYLLVPVIWGFSLGWNLSPSRAPSRETHVSRRDQHDEPRGTRHTHAPILFRGSKKTRIFLTKSKYTFDTYTAQIISATLQLICYVLAIYIVITLHCWTMFLLQVSVAKVSVEKLLKNVSVCVNLTSCSIYNSHCADVNIKTNVMCIYILLFILTLSWHGFKTININTNTVRNRRHDNVTAQRAHARLNSCLYRLCTCKLRISRLSNFNKDWTDQVSSIDSFCPNYKGYPKPSKVLLRTNLLEHSKTKILKRKCRGYNSFLINSENLLIRELISRAQTWQYDKWWKCFSNFKVIIQTHKYANSIFIKKLLLLLYGIYLYIMYT